MNETSGLATMPTKSYLAGSPYHLEDILGINPYERARRGTLTHLLLNQPPVCDCHCRRCFMPASRRGVHQNELTLEEYCGVVRDAAKAGIICLEISGEGEPLLSDKLSGVIQCAKECGLITTLITNGHALTDDFVEFAFGCNVTLVLSLFSLDCALYEMDNSLPGSFENTFRSIERAAQIYRPGNSIVGDKYVYRIAIHTTAQADNLGELDNIRSFCDQHGIFFSIAPLAPVGGGAALLNLHVPTDGYAIAEDNGHNSIILSHTSKHEVGREVCGTCLYGLNIGYDGNVLFDAHAGYEVGGMLGNVRTECITELIQRQRRFAPLMFSQIDGFCPIRDPKWSHFLNDFIANPVL